MNSTGNEWAYHHRQENKENYNFNEMKASRAEGFSTPVKNRPHLINAAEAFATPASVFHNRMNSSMDTPSRGTESKYLEHDPQAANYTLLTTDEIPIVPPDYCIQEIKNRIVHPFVSSGVHQGMWVTKYDAITMLRALNKTYPEEIYDVFMHFGDQIMASLNMKVPVIHKSILAFIYEVITVKRSKPLEEAIVERLIPIIINRTRSSSGTIRRMAKESLKEICEHHLCNSSLMKFAELSLDKNFSLAETAFKGLAYSINCLGDSISQISTRTLQGIFVVFAKIVYHKRAGSIKLATDGARYLNRMMGFDNYTKMLKILIDDGHISLDEGNLMVAILDANPQELAKDKLLEVKREIAFTRRKNKGQFEPGIEILPDKVTASKADAYERGRSSGGFFFASGGQQASFFR